MKLRAVLACAALAALALIAACATTTNPTTGTTTVTVSLANSQAEATAINNALAAEAAAVQTTNPALTTSLKALNVATQAFVALPANSPTIAQYASAFAQAAAGVVALIPGIGAPTALAIDFGLALINGLIAGQQTVTVPTQTTTASLVIGGTAKVIPGPIPIPVH